MYRSATLLLIILAASLPATSVAAQVDTHPTDTRSGAWFGFGAGLGSQSVSCSICTQDRRVGTAVYLRGGATLNPRVRLGLETTGWARFDEVDQFVGSVGLIAHFYPDPGRGLFLKAGPAITFFRAKDDEDTQIGSTSYGLTVGAGYEVPVRPGWSLTPFLDLMASTLGTLTSEGQSITGRTGVTLIQLGVGLTLH